MVQSGQILPKSDGTFVDGQIKNGNRGWSGALNASSTSETNENNFLDVSVLVAIFSGIRRTQRNCSLTSRM